MADGPRFQHHKIKFETDSHYRSADCYRFVWKAEVTNRQVPLYFFVRATITTIQAGVRVSVTAQPYLLEGYQYQSLPPIPCDFLGFEQPNTWSVDWIFRRQRYIVSCAYTIQRGDIGWSARLSFCQDLHYGLRTPDGTLVVGGYILEEPAQLSQEH